MSTFGRIEEFIPNKSNSWENYRERLNFYFLANDITEDIKKRAVFLSVCGPALYAIIRSLCTPASPGNVDYNEIITKLKSHFSPTPSEILSRFKFHKRDQRSHESVAEFLAELRSLSEHCKFGNQLDSMIRDRLVCGIRDENTQKKLLADSALTLERATEIALSGEAASRHTMEIRGSVSDVQYMKNKFQKTPKFTDRPSAPAKKTCSRCGRQHPLGECKFLKATCFFCKKIGHLASVCNSKAKSKLPPKNKNKVHVLNATAAEKQEKESETEDYSTFHNLHSLSTVTECPPTDISVKLNGKKHTMEVDSGSLHSVISSSQFVKLWPVHPPELLPVTDQSLRTWTCEKLNIKGFADVTVEYNSNKAKLPLLVVEGSGKSLVGRSWFNNLGISVMTSSSAPVNQVSADYSSIIEKFPNLFSDTMGIFHGTPVTIKINEEASPKFLKARPVPFALRERVTQEIDTMVQKGILEPIQYSDWATPVVPVVKKDGSIRLCGDYRSTVNQVVKQFVYPLPTVNEVLSTVTGGTVFSKLDLSEAYLQLPVDKVTSQLLTLHTHKGLFRVKRLPFGVSVAVSIFQKRIEEVLTGIDGVLPYLDDIFVKGRDMNDHNKKLQLVLHRLDQAGLRLRRQKCKFAVPEIELLGFKVTKDGIQPTADKVTAIHKAPVPSNKTELQAFLGMLNFYGCFIKNRSHVLEVFHQLLRKDEPWKWTAVHNKAYEEAKDLLQKSNLLVHYDETLPLILTCDASSYGLGAVLGHVFPDGREAPIAYFSCTLSSAERNYSQTDREALAIVAAVKKFNQYVMGRKFQIITDHKPLLGLFGPEKPLPQMVSPRVLRWSLLLSAYDYKLIYRKGKDISNADALSRLPVATPDNSASIPELGDVLLLETTQSIPLNSHQVSHFTKKDKILSRVHLWILNGWPDTCPEECFKPYFRRQNELTVYCNCILWGSRVVIPETLQKQVLTLLHEFHPGIVRMKGLARSYVWWPKMDADIELAVKTCMACQENQRLPPKAPINPWPWTEKPWSRLHIDFAGPFYGQTFFLVVDSHSKWLEVLPVSSMSSSAAITNLRSIFATHGLPDTIASDNGATFKSEEFQAFLKKNLIRQVFVAPYHPSSNGQAERMVATTKQALKKIIHGEWRARLARFLFSQHTLPCTSTGKTPAELLMRRRLTSYLDRLHPDLYKERGEKREDATRGQKVRTFEVEDPVFIKNYSSSGPPWVPATIVRSTGPLSYETRAVSGVVSKRHVDQIRSRVVPSDEPTTSSDEGSASVVPSIEHAPGSDENSLPVLDAVLPTPQTSATELETRDILQGPQTDISPELLPVPDEVSCPVPETVVPVEPVRRSRRVVTRPKHLNDYVLSNLTVEECYVSSLTPERHLRPY